MKGILAIALVAAIAFAGCLGDSDSTSSTTSKATSGTSTSKTGTSTATSTGTSTATSTTTSTSTSTSGPPQEKSHTATLTANVRNGTAPLNVTFTLSATNVDAQTTWTLAFGDNTNRTGTALPATVTHRYNTTGTKTAQATVRFGDGKTATTSLSIAVLPASTGNGSALLNKTFAATIPIPKPFPTGVGDVCAVNAAGCSASQISTLNDNGANGTFFVWYDFTVPAGAASLLVEAGSHGETCAPSGDCVPDDFDLYIYAPDGTPTSIGTEAGWEVAAVDAPSAGAWSVAVVYFAGPPNGEATTHIVVR